MSAFEGRSWVKNWTGWLLLGFVILAAAFLAIVGWQDAIAAMQQLTPFHVFVLFALASTHYFIRAIRWHVLLRANGIKARFTQSLGHILGGFAMTATPGRVGELVRLRWLRRETGRELTELASVALADRAMELGSLLLVIVMVFSYSGLRGGTVWGLLFTASVIVVVSCQPRRLEDVLGWFWRGIGRRKPRLFIKLRRVIRELGPLMRMSVLAPLLFVGLIGWACEGLSFWALLKWLGAPQSLPTAMAIFLVAVLSGALSGLPGGLGGMEVTAVGLLTLQGISPETGVLAVLIIRISTLWFAIFVGTIAFPIVEFRSTFGQGSNDADL